MQDAAVVLEVLRERGRKGLPLSELYRQMFNPAMYLLAYGRIYSNQGAMTPGACGETADGMSEAMIGEIIELMRLERYRFAPARRVYIPKKNGTLRPLGIPSWRDKLTGEVVRLILEAVYEPVFSSRSHGFRKGRGCHTALRQVRDAWTGTVWFIEGDISDCYGSVDHEILMRILAEKIGDQRFLRLIRGMLRAGYLEDWEFRDTLSGTPQGGVITPPTQWITLVHVTLRVGCVVVAAAAGGPFPDRDAVADGDLLRSDEDVLDQQPQYPLPLADAGGGGAAAQLGEEAVQVVGELEVGVLVGGLGVERLDLAAQAGLAGPQVRHPGAQLVDGDQLLGVGLDHRGDRGGCLGQRELELVALPGDGVGGAGLGEPAVDLGADQGGVGEQAGDVVPHDGVEVVGADRLVAAHPAALVAVVVGAEAPVVVDLVARRGGRVAAVVGVAAGRARGQALQQGGDLAVAGGEPLVVGQPLAGAGEGVLVHDGRDRDLGPLFAGPVHGLDRPGGGPSGQPGDPVQARLLVDDLGLAEDGTAGVGGVAQHAPDHRPVPAVLAGAGRHALAAHPAGQVGDGGAAVGIAAEHPGDQHRLVLDDLVPG